MPHDRRRAEVEGVADPICQSTVAQGAGAEGVDLDTGGPGLADHVGQLHFTRGGQTGGGDVFSGVAGGIGCDTVDAGRILASERRPAVAGELAVGVDRVFAPRQPRMDRRTSASGEKGLMWMRVCSSGRIGSSAKAGRITVSVMSSKSWGVDRFAMTGDECDAVDPFGLALAEFHGDLHLAVGVEIGVDPVVPHPVELPGQLVGQMDRQGHQRGGLIAGETQRTEAKLLSYC